MIIGMQIIVLKMTPDDCAFDCAQLKMQPAIQPNREQRLMFFDKFFQNPIEKGTSCAILYPSKYTCFFRKVPNSAKKPVFLLKNICIYIKIRQELPLPPDHFFRFVMSVRKFSRKGLLPHNIFGPPSTYACIARNLHHTVPPRWEGGTVIRKMAPVKVIVHFPKTHEGKEALARRVSDIHASAVNQRLKGLNCPTQQKLALLDAVIATAKQHSREQNR